MTEQPTCGTCRFWMTASSLREEAKKGCCLRYPPTFVKLGESASAATYSDRWCGEHKPAEAPSGLPDNAKCSICFEPATTAVFRCDKHTSSAQWTADRPRVKDTR